MRRNRRGRFSSRGASLSEHTSALRIVTGWRGGEATPPRGDLNLGSGDACFLETLAEVDFNSYRPRDLTHMGQSSGEPF